MAGELLKKRREELGLDLRAIADLLRIKADYLESIEEDRFEKLPVAVYTVGYIRCYASYLNIDPGPLIDLYSGHLTRPLSSTVIPVSASRKKAPLYYYLVPVLVTALVIFVVFILPHEASRSGKKPADVQVRPSPATVDRSRAFQKTGDEGQYSLEIIANDLTWMHITLGGGKFEELLLRPGMTRAWTLKGTAILKLGNAGGIRIKFNGIDIGTPGSLGQVMTLIFPEYRQLSVKEQ
jgi:transcriptional regulator with XRE-family HTH domain